MIVYVIIGFLILSLVCFLVVFLLPKKEIIDDNIIKSNNTKLSDEEENVLSIFEEYGESKDKYIIVDSREVTSLPTEEDEARWIREAEEKYNKNNK
jgi:hypothetical protein